MFNNFNNFKKKPMINRPSSNEDCKIKIKNTKYGIQIEFSGNCTKEQISMAKINFDSDDSEIEED